MRRRHFVGNKYESTYSIFFIVKGHKEEENVAVKKREKKLEDCVKANDLHKEEK